MTWIVTASGREFDLLRPDALLVDIQDIAHALSLLNRFGGHSIEPMSVAQHSHLVMCLCESSDPAVLRAALLHDAAEAYIGDIVSPLKRLLEADLLETGVRAAISEALGEPWPLPPETAALVEKADRVALVTERNQIMPESKTPWQEDRDGVIPSDERIEPWPWRTARERFLAAARRLGIRGA